MGFVADLLMYKIQRSDQMSDLQKAQQAMSGAQPGQVGGGMSIGQGIWGGGLGMGQQQAQAQPGVGDMLMSRMGQNQPAALDSNNVPMAMTGNGAQGMAPGGYQPRGIMGQNQMANALLSNPTTAAMFPQMMNAYFSDQAAMDRQVQEQGWRTNTVMPYDRETQIQMQQMRNQQSAANARLDLPGKYQDQESKLRKEYAGYSKPLEQSIDRYNATTNMLQNRGGDFKNVTGADAIAMVKDFAKTILPNEAVMSGDEQAIAQAAQSTFGGSIDSWLNKLNGKSPIAPAELANMYRVMSERNQLNQQNLAGLQQQYSGLSRAYGLNPTNVVGEKIYQAATAQATAQPGSVPLASQPG